MHAMQPSSVRFLPSWLQLSLVPCTQQRSRRCTRQQRAPPSACRRSARGHDGLVLRRRRGEQHRTHDAGCICETAAAAAAACRCPILLAAAPAAPGCCSQGPALPVEHIGLQTRPGRGAAPCDKRQGRVRGMHAGCAAAVRAAAHTLPLLAGSSWGPTAMLPSVDDATSARPARCVCILCLQEFGARTYTLTSLCTCAALAACAQEVSMCVRSSSGDSPWAQKGAKR